MKWPRGKYNGCKIGGIEIKVRINVFWWNWKPKVYHDHLWAFHWICFHIWIAPEYELYTTKKKDNP